MSEITSSDWTIDQCLLWVATRDFSGVTTAEARGWDSWMMLWVWVTVEDIDRTGHGLLHSREECEALFRNALSEGRLVAYSSVNGDFKPVPKQWFARTDFYSDRRDRIYISRESATSPADRAANAMVILDTDFLASDVMSAFPAFVEEAAAKRRLADEYDAAQDRGEVASGRPKSIPDGNTSATLAEIGMTAKVVHEARQFRDAEVNSPGVVNVLSAPVPARQPYTAAELTSLLKSDSPVRDRRGRKLSFERACVALALVTMFDDASGGQRANPSPRYVKVLEWSARE